MNHIRQKIAFFKITDKIIDILIISISFFLSIVSESLYHSNIIMPFKDTFFNPNTLILSTFVFLITISYIERYFFYRLGVTVRPK